MYGIYISISIQGQAAGGITYCNGQTYIDFKDRYITNMGIYSTN